MVNLKINKDTLDSVYLVIFDKDGTLIDLYNYWSCMVGFRATLAQEKLGFNESQKKDIMYAMGVDLDKCKLRSEGPVGLKKREIVLQSMIDALAEIGFTDTAYTYDLCFDAFKEADRMSVEHLSEIIKPIDGMHRLVNILHNKGCRIAIATTDKSERARLAIRYLGISDKVDIAVGEDMVNNYKPSPDMVNLILRKLSVDKMNAVIVGDAITDIEMGNNTGLLASIGVCSGLTTREKLLEKTRYVVDDVSKIEIS